MQVPISLGYDSGEQQWRVFVQGEGSFITTDYTHWRDAIQTAHESGFALTSPHLNEAVALCREQRLPPVVELPPSSLTEAEIDAIAAATIELHGKKLR